MTISSLEATVDQQQQDEQQQQFEHLAEQLENNNKKKRPTVNTKTKRVGGYNNRYNQGVSRYNNQQQYYPYVYYYSPQSPYYPTAVDAASPNINITTRDDEDLEIIMHDESTIHNTSPDQHKIPDLKKQLEYYFSRQNLVNDTFLVSQMDSDLYVPISLIANFKRVREWTTDINVIVTTLRESSAVTVDDSGTRVKPNISLERSTVILRDVPECTEEEITNYLKEIDVPSVQSMKKDIGNLWYFTFESESDALRLFNNVKGKPFKNQTLAARMKSEPALRVQTRTAATPSSNHSINAIVEQGNEYPYTGFYYPYQNAYQNNRRNSNTRSFNNRSPNKIYYNQNNNRQQQQQNEYHKTSPVGGRSARGGYKSKNYNRSPRSPTTNDDNDTNGHEYYKSRIDTQDMESGVSNLSLQPNEDGARKQSYHNQKQKQQHQRPYNQQNKPYVNNKLNNGESSVQEASATSETTSFSNDNKRYNNTRNYNRNHNNDTRNDTENSGDNTRRHSNDTRSYGDNTRRYSNDTRGYNNNRNYSNDTRRHSNDETGNHKNNADKPRKKFYKNNNNSQEVTSDQKKKYNQDASEQLTATHFPPLPNQQAETDIAQTMPEAGLTRSVADIVKSSVQTKKDEKTNIVTKQTPPEPTKEEEEEAFPILCQTTEFRTNSSSYADILKK